MHIKSLLSETSDGVGTVTYFRAIISHGVTEKLPPSLKSNQSAPTPISSLEADTNRQGKGRRNNKKKEKKKKKNIRSTISIVMASCSSEKAGFFPLTFSALPRDAESFGETSMHFLSFKCTFHLLPETFCRRLSHGVQRLVQVGCENDHLSVPDGL